MYVPDCGRGSFSGGHSGPPRRMAFEAPARLPLLCRCPAWDRCSCPAHACPFPPGTPAHQQCFCSDRPFRAQLQCCLLQEAAPDPMAGPQQSPRRPPPKLWPHRVMLTYIPNSPTGLGAPMGKGLCLSHAWPRHVEARCMSADVEGGRKEKGTKGKKEGRENRAGSTVPVLPRTRTMRNRGMSKPSPHRRAHRTFHLGSETAERGFLLMR